jgi:hypothetical protein
MSKFLKKDGKLVKQNGKLVKTDDPASCKCCPIDDPCLFGLCIWRPPDPCSTGKCFPTLLQDPDDPDPCPGLPYDCKSEAACNAWYAANPNPPCDCWFCEDGTWVNKPSLNCINEGGILGQKPPDGDCLPPPGLWCCDGGTEGYFCGERVNVPGIGQMVGDAPIGICNSVIKVDDCSECGAPPIVSCGEKVPKTASVSLCGIIDRAGTTPPACLGGQPGFAAPFNQTVELKLIEPIDFSVATVWEGELSLPDGYAKHKLTLSRGTETSGFDCDGAALVLQGAPSSFGCATARWARNYDNPLGGFGTWKFGSRFASTQLRIQTLSGGIWWDGSSVCTLTFGGAKVENPLP